VVLPGRDAGEFEWVSFEQSGVLTTAQATELVGRGALRGHLRLGRWRRVCRGIVLTHNGDLTPAQQQWAAVLVSGPDAMLAGATAAAASGVQGLRCDSIAVLVPATRSASVRLPRLPPDMTGVRVHRSTVLPERHRQVGRPPRTTVARSVVDAAAWAGSEREALTAIAAACQQRRVTPDEILEVLTVLTRVRRRALIRCTLADIAGGALALSEIDLVTLCRRYRLPRPDLQQRRRDANGRIRYLDAYWREWQVHVEVDGAHHMDVRHWAADMVRQNEVWIAGDRILRFPAWLLRTHPADVAAQLHAALRAAGYRGAP
jgi:very-short-patch-repair endonuclease